MRSDKSLDSSLRNARSWKQPSYDHRLVDAERKRAERSGTTAEDFALQMLSRQSFSGNERNKLFYNVRAQQFVDLSALSGLDNPMDGRVFAIWDFDRDGWQDIAAANAGTPMLNIYRNEVSTYAGTTGTAGNVIAIRFCGGSTSDQPNYKFSCRDGYGAMIHVTTNGKKIVREHRCGEGMATQNSTTMIVGIGEAEVVQSVVVRWPSGITQQVDNIPAGTLLTVHEDPSHCSSDTGVVRQKYQVAPSKKRWDVTPNRDTATFRLPGINPRPRETPRIKPKVLLYTTMASWCAACRLYLPELRQLRAKLGDSIELFGVPVDESDDRVKLLDYEKQHRPAYRLLKNLTQHERTTVKQHLADSLSTDALPSTIVTDLQGNVLSTTTGLPTISDIQQLLVRPSASPQ